MKGRSNKLKYPLASATDMGVNTSSEIMTKWFVDQWALTSIALARCVIKSSWVK